MHVKGLSINDVIVGWVSKHSNGHEPSIFFLISNMTHVTVSRVDESTNFMVKLYGQPRRSNWTSSLISLTLFSDHQIRQVLKLQSFFPFINWEKRKIFVRKSGMEMMSSKKSSVLLPTTIRIIENGKRKHSYTYKFTFFLHSWNRKRKII